HDGKFSEGCFKTTEVEKKAGENLKIVVHFPPGKDPPGDEGKLLNRYIGDVAKDTGMLPVSTDEWRLVERSLKEDYWRTFFERKVAQNKKNTDKQKSHHAGGSRLYTRYHEELFLQTGKEPSRGEWWKRANLRPNGEWEDDLAAYIAVYVNSLWCSVTSAYTSHGQVDYSAAAREERDRRIAERLQELERRDVAREAEMAQEKDRLGAELRKEKERLALEMQKEKQRVEDVIQKERQRVARLESIVTKLSTTVLNAADEPFPYIDQEASDDEQAQASEKDDD
ncbi:hypothetical protein LINPERPRIM_LOCUS30608, partial [Linum perenne]